MDYLIVFSGPINYITYGFMEDEEELREKLIELKQEHKDLDDVIDRLMQHQPVDFIQLQRLKKRKLSLKDTIQRIESGLLPDIIA